MKTIAPKHAVDVLWDDNPVDVTAEVNQIWSVAQRLRGLYQSDKYKNVIIPMTILRRLECALAPTKPAVLKYAAAHPDAPARRLENISGFPFYNTSRLDLKELLADPDGIATGLCDYLDAFSPNVKDIFANLEFKTEIRKMESGDRLYSVVQSYSELDLDPRTVDPVKMGYVFEDLIRRFSENAEAGDHYTGRDIGKLMVNLLLAEGADDVLSEPKVVPILDQACGTAGLLTTAYNFIRRFNPDADVWLFGQEVNPESYAICLAEMLIKGQDADNIRKQDTMKADCFPDLKMRFVIENPPFGTPWAGKDAPVGTEKAVREEHEKGFSGRWGAGLPAGGDMQLLFVQSAVDKLADDGRAAIIENGSPLFTGGVASGESQIRRWLVEQDLLEAIVALPTDLFYNTGIATYIWILSKHKAPHRAGKVQLIDATSFCKPLRKSLGNKRFEITPEDRKRVTELYAAFEENEFCQIHPAEDFLYREYAVYRPARGPDGSPLRDRKGRPVLDKTTKDSETVPYAEPVERYMAREVLPHVPDAVAVFEEDLSKRKPVVRTGAEFPFTRWFFKREPPRPAGAVLADLVSLEHRVSDGFARLAALAADDGAGKEASK